MYSQRADIRYQRLMNTFAVGCPETNLSFFISLRHRALAGTSSSWRSRAQDGQWVTLPEANEHTGTSTGDSCPEGWHELHPWLIQYQGADCAGTGLERGFRPVGRLDRVGVRPERLRRRRR